MKTPFQTTPIGQLIRTNGYELYARNAEEINQKNFDCSYCYFREMSENCPQGDKFPACFGSERTDKTPVYFTTKSPYGEKK